MRFLGLVFSARRTPPSAAPAKCQSRNVLSAWGGGTDEFDPRPLMRSGQRPILLACRGWAFGFAPGATPPTAMRRRSRTRIGSTPTAPRRAATGNRRNRLAGQAVVGRRRCQRQASGAWRPDSSLAGRRTNGWASSIAFRSISIGFGRVVGWWRSYGQRTSSRAGPRSWMRRKAAGLLSGAHPDRLAARRRAGRRGRLAGRPRSKPIGPGSIPVTCSHALRHSATTGRTSQEAHNHVTHRSRDHRIRADFELGGPGDLCESNRAGNSVSRG
jgi:hypothetical protein